jgi:hypothetical protein
LGHIWRLNHLHCSVICFGYVQFGRQEEDTALAVAEQKHDQFRRERKSLLKEINGDDAS